MNKIENKGNARLTKPSGFYWLMISLVKGLRKNKQENTNTEIIKIVKGTNYMSGLIYQKLGDTKSVGCGRGWVSSDRLASREAEILTRVPLLAHLPASASGLSFRSRAPRVQLPRLQMRKKRGILSGPCQSPIPPAPAGLHTDKPQVSFLGRMGEGSCSVTQTHANQGAAAGHPHVSAAGKPGRRQATSAQRTGKQPGDCRQELMSPKAEGTEPTPKKSPPFQPPSPRMRGRVCVSSCAFGSNN